MITQVSPVESLPPASRGSLDIQEALLLKTRYCGKQRILGRLGYGNTRWYIPVTF